MLEATTAAETPRTTLERVTTKIKPATIGVPLATAKAEHERLQFQALAVSHLMPSLRLAYATEAILITS